MIDWIWKLCNMVLQSNAVPVDQRTIVIVLLDIGRGSRTECRSYRGISLLNIVKKIYAGILVKQNCRMTEGLTDDEWKGF